MSETKSNSNEEIRQLVLEEVEAAILPLKKTVAGLETQLAGMKKTDGGTKKKKEFRLKPNEILKLRKKWKLNRKTFGGLFRVPGEEVRDWERGKHSPAPKTVELIVHISYMSKKERNALLQAIAADAAAASSQSETTTPNPA